MCSLCSRPERASLRSHGRVRQLALAHSRPVPKHLDGMTRRYDAKQPGRSSRYTGRASHYDRRPHRRHPGDRRRRPDAGHEPLRGADGSAGRPQRYSRRRPSIRSRDLAAPRNFHHKNAEGVRRHQLRGRLRQDRRPGVPPPGPVPSCGSTTSTSPAMRAQRACGSKSSSAAPGYLAAVEQIKIGGPREGPQARPGAALGRQGAHHRMQTILDQSTLPGGSRSRSGRRPSSPPPESSSTTPPGTLLPRSSWLPSWRTPPEALQSAAIELI